MQRFITICAVVCVLFLSALRAEPIRLVGTGGAFTVPVKSLKTMKWNNVVRQAYDFSCGAAAIATLLTYHYDRPTSEETVFKEMFENGNQKKIQTAGFSLLDMKQYLDAQGLRSDGFRMTLDKFARIGVPGITMINTKGYNHFVVVKGIEGNRVLLADPALGTRVIKRDEFNKTWNHAILAARESMQLARQRFNQSKDWRINPQSPVGRGIYRKGIGTLSLTIPSGLQEFGR